MPPCTDSNQSYPYSVRLSPVGTAEDGYTHTILNLNLHTTEPIVTVLRAGQVKLCNMLIENAKINSRELWRRTFLSQHLLSTLPENYCNGCL